MNRSQQAIPGGPKRRLLWLLVPLVLLSGLEPPSRATSNFTFYVDATSSATTDCAFPPSNPCPGSGTCTGNCLTPTCGTQGTPCQTIQQAINLANCAIGTNAALEADVIVAGGTVPTPKAYNEKIVIFPNIHIIGAGRDITTIDPSTPVYRGTPSGNAVVSFATFGTAGFCRPEVKFSITKFKLTHGTGRVIMDSVIPTIREIGGGGVCIFGDAMVTDCRIEDNTLSNVPDPTAPDWKGAGIYIARGGPIISGNIIQRNFSNPPNLSGQDKAEGWGGGIYAFRDLSSSLNALHPIITHNIIRDNAVVAQDVLGGGMCIFSGLGTLLTNNFVLGNSLNLPGGANYIYAQSGGLYLYANNTSVYNNLVMGNVGNGGGGGIAVRAESSPVTLTNNTIVGNIMHQHTIPKSESVSNQGAGIFAQEFTAPQVGLVHLTNQLISLNDVTATGAGGGLFSDQALAPNDHNDFFGNRPAASEIAGDYPPGSVIGSNGNINLNPVFVHAPNFWDHTNALGTSTTVIVFDSTRYAPGNIIEYNDDGVSRTITSINSSSKTLTFTPAIIYKICSNVPNRSCVTNADCVSPGTCVTASTQDKRILANWGSSTNVTEDLRLTAGSPLIDAGTNTGAPSSDLDDLPRPTDGDQNGSFIADIGAFEFHLPDTDGDGIPDTMDCAPLINSAWTLPVEVPSPVAMSSSEVLSWPRIPQVNVYNVYFGTIVSPFTYNQTCLIGEVPGLSASTIVGVPPAVDAAYFYLVGGVNFCGHGILHSNPTVQAIPACSSQGQDADSDGVINLNDNCPLLSNTTQADPDHDTVGSACDNCPAIYNPSQLDTNSNTIGDHCEDADNDTYPLTVDCNDNNPAVHPGAVELCNGADDNCNSQIDEGGSSLCVDSDPCTQDVCGGASGCLHPPVVCAAPDTCHDPGTCNSTSGLCENAPSKPDGSPCDDGIACTSPDTCLSGVCQGPGTDADGDTHFATACGGDDCNDSNSQVWLVPLEVANLTLTTASPADPSWDSQGLLVGPETTYDLVSGSMGPLTGFSFSTGACLQEGGPNSFTDARPNPAVDTGFWYLARGENSCGFGTYGSASRDAATTACP